MKRYVIVAGNIGVGKSTLVQLLSQQLGWYPYYEPVGENPYLADFYQDMRAWAFHSQVFFLTNRLRTHSSLLGHPTSVIQDRSVYEDSEVFARNLYEQYLIQERDYLTYRALYQAVLDLLPAPDLVIYLRASVSTLLNRISHRDRTFEREISGEYLGQLNKLYEQWIRDFKLCPVLTVPGDDLDYVARPAHLNLILEKIHEKLSGKEEVSFAEEEINGA